MIDLKRDKYVDNHVGMITMTFLSYALFHKIQQLVNNLPDLYTIKVKEA